MIIILSHQLASITWNPSSVEGVEKALLSAYYGNHYLIIESLKAGEALIVKLENHISPQALSVLKRLKANFSTRSAVKDLAEKKLVIASDSSQYNSDEFIFLSVFESNNFDYSRTLLLSENIKDSKIYKKLSEIYLVHENISSSLKISFEERGAGGSQIADELKAICDDGSRFVVSVCDSDKQWPNASSSSISKECAHHLSSFSLGEHIDIEIRDIENLIPIEFIRNYASSFCEDSTEKLNKMLHIDRNLIYHFDIKNGLSVSKYHEYLSKNQSKEFWSKIDKFYNDITCNNLNSELKICGSSNCNCTIINPISSRLVEDFKDWLEKNSANKSYELLRNTSNSVWKSIIQRIFFWGLSERPRLV